MGAATTSTGAFFTGLLGVGIGEVITSQLVKGNHFPVAVAAARSVFTVIVTIASASFTQIAALIAAGGAKAIAGLFGVIGVAMMWIVLRLYR